MPVSMNGKCNSAYINDCGDVCMVQTIVIVLIYFYCKYLYLMVLMMVVMMMRMMDVCDLSCVCNL